MAHGRRLYINETELVSGTVGKHTVYHLDVRDGDEAWRVSKRFSEIREFRDVLVPKCSGVEFLLYFPQPTFRKRTSDEEVERRRRMLEIFLQLCVDSRKIWKLSVTQEFLEVKYNKKRTTPRYARIVETETVSGRFGGHVVYHIQVKLRDQVWDISARYSTLRALRDELMKRYPEKEILELFPSKTITAPKGDALEERKNVLEAFCVLMVNDNDVWKDEAFRAFLLGKDPKSATQASTSATPGDDDGDDDDGDGDGDGDGNNTASAAGDGGGGSGDASGDGKGRRPKRSMFRIRARTDEATAASTEMSDYASGDDNGGEGTSAAGAAATEVLPPREVEPLAALGTRLQTWMDSGVGGRGELQTILSAYNDHIANGNHRPDLLNNTVVCLALMAELIEDEDPGGAEQCLLVAEEKASRLAAMDMDGDSMAVVAGNEAMVMYRHARMLLAAPEPQFPVARHLLEAAIPKFEAAILGDDGRYAVSFCYGMAILRLCKVLELAADRLLPLAIAHFGDLAEEAPPDVEYLFEWNSIWQQIGDTDGASTRIRHILLTHFPAMLTFTALDRRTVLLWRDMLQSQIEFGKTGAKEALAAKCAEVEAFAEFLASAPGDCMHYGFVFKRGKRRKNWKKRFAVLTRTDGLRYYESAGVSSSLKGTIAVDEIQEVTTFVDVNLEGKLGLPRGSLFQISTPGRTFYLGATATLGRDGWLAALRRARDGDLAPARPVTHELEILI